MSKRILIADDEPNIVISLEFLMQQNGYDVRIARNGEDALALIETFAPHLVLLDVMLPLRNGLQVCQTIRDQPQHSQTRILMLTAKGREAEVHAGLAAGADAYITKPFSTKELVAQVRALLTEG